MSSLEQLEPLIAAKCSELGFELFEARFFRAGSRSILRIFIDSDKGVKVADCESVSNALSILLDVENFQNGRSYTLEVSSPGIDRPLKAERDFKRILGKNVKVNLREPFDGKIVLNGTVERCENNKLYLNDNGTYLDLSLDLVLSAKEEITFK
jgi:ribosome maturation factor RimP